MRLYKHFEWIFQPLLNLKQFIQLVLFLQTIMDNFYDFLHSFKDV